MYIVRLRPGAYLFRFLRGSRTAAQPIPASSRTNQRTGCALSPVCGTGRGVGSPPGVGVAVGLVLGPADGVAVGLPLGPV